MQGSFIVAIVFTIFLQYRISFYIDISFCYFQLFSLSAQKSVLEDSIAELLLQREQIADDNRVSATRFIDMEDEINELKLQVVFWDVYTKWYWKKNLLWYYEYSHCITAKYGVKAPKITHSWMQFFQLFPINLCI